MKHLSAFIACLIFAGFVHAQPTLKEARDEWLQGNYAEAREMYETLAKDVKLRQAATLGLSRALESQGEYDKAMKALDAALKDMPKDADLLARQAELYHLRGRWEEAAKSAQAALEANKDNFLAHWVLAEVQRDRGQFEKADEQYLWFIKTSQTKNITDPDELVLAGLAGLERAKYHHITDEYQTVVSNYFQEASRAQKDKENLYWQGEYEAGRVFMDKHNKPAAFRAFERAMTINPRSAEVLVCKGQMAASHMEFKDADKYATQALKVNPSYVPALCLMSDVHWFSSENDAAMKRLVKAREVNPRDEATLARIAACYYAQGKLNDFQALIKEAQKNNPKCYTFYTDLANLLEQRKFNADAEKYYTLAIKMQPKFAEAQTGLGMLYMRMAKEAEAKKVLESGLEADPFNIRVSNSLKVLDHLEGYATLKTKHFIIRFDQKNDVVLANFMAIYLEDIYNELADQFDYRPEGPFQIQIFKRHDMFSGRIIAVPELFTIGACTGPLVAMVSPRDTIKFTKLFNWNRVIRHELVHVFNLQQTNGKVPHWFTEGLAVRYEGKDPPPTWNALLADKFRADEIARRDKKAAELLDLDTILLGFIRPRSPLQREQAYLQSLLYVEYLTKTHGEKSVGKMLAAFADGLDTGPALEKACNVKQADFEKGYRAFLAEKVKNMPARQARKEMTLKELREAHKKNPADNDIAAQLAEKDFFLGTATAKKEAKELADKVLRDDPRHATAAYVKALTLIDENKADTAYSVLDAVATDDLKDTKPLKLLLKLQVSAKKLPQAARTCERARKIDPDEPSWIMALGQIYEKTGQKDKLLEIYEDLAKLDGDNLAPRKALAVHFLEKGNNAEAARYARLGLEIDVLDADCQRVIIEALNALNRQDEANRLKMIFGL
jgi:cellulose synthase operon protein C